MQDFHDSLYMNVNPTTKQYRFNFDKKKSQMTLITQTKPALNSNLTKLRVADNLVSVEPLRKDGKYI